MKVNRRDFLAQTGMAAAVAAAGAVIPQAGEPNGVSVAQQAQGAKTMLNVAVLSKWHPHAKGYAQSLKKMPDVKISAVWDEDAARGQEWAKELEAPFEGNLDAVLARKDVDAICVTAPTSMHPEIMIGAAKAGKHIFTEKVLALTVKDCNRIGKAVRAANVKFCISFPYRTRPDCLYAHKAVQDGLLGQLTSLRVRVAHNGASAAWLPAHFYDPKTCGGGAMMDLGAHPMYLSRWFCGQPKRISSTFTSMTGHEIEDNAVSVIEFENKSIAVSETSFVSTNSPFTLELSGTEGSLVVGGPEDRHVTIQSTKLESKGWVTPPELPAAPPAAIQMWVDAILRNGTIPFGIEEATQLTELMEYAYIAHRKQRQVEIPPRASV
ncbi:MAG: Gfo/Idh/MocA family oxidoreductase [Candidatus Hydrogenedentes bacterium]|nr:Gfo/Idh/MocA family oxidoreductase [Candidatus Hydrogenedentota bacterium]